MQALDDDLAALSTAHDALKHEAEQQVAANADLASQLAVATEALDAAQARLPEIEELQKQVAAAHEAMSDARFAHQEAAKAAAAALEAAQQATAEAQAEREALEVQVKDRDAALQALQDEVGAVRGALADAEEDAASKAAYVHQLEGIVMLFVDSPG